MFINILLFWILMSGLLAAFLRMRKEFSGEPVFFWCMTLVVWMASLIPYGIAIEFLAPLEGIERVVSRGERIGTVTRLSETGYFWKTWEGEMQSGGVDDNGKTKIYHFSVPGSDLLGPIQGSLGKKVVLKYREWLCMPYWVGASGYEVTGIRQP